jgi:putative thioredoxin
MSQFTVDVTADNFEKEVIEASRHVPVVIDFWAPWCAPCRSLKPILERLAEAYAGRFILAKLNTDELPELAQRFGIRGIPDVKAVINGEVVAEFTGAIPEPKVRAFLDDLFPGEGRRCVWRRRRPFAKVTSKGPRRLCVTPSTGSRH